MNFTAIQFILTDIEGTTTSVSFVYETLFPYFRQHIGKLKDLQHLPEVHQAFEETIELAASDGIHLVTTDQIIAQLLEWSLADKKITPLKTVQGILWEEGYTSGEIRGHVYPDVAPNLVKWKKGGFQLGVFSSGSVAAQKLIFGFSQDGDLTPSFSAYFDTNTGGKRETKTYTKISKIVEVNPENILFLSDIKEELIAADEAGFQTIQLVREGNTAEWKKIASSFDEVLIE